MNKNYIWLVVALLLVIWCSTSWADVKNDYTDQITDPDAEYLILHHNKKTPRWIKFKSNKKISHNKYFGRYLKEKDTKHMKQTKRFKDKFGLRHTRYQLYHKGLKVIGAEYIIHDKNDHVGILNEVKYIAVADHCWNV